jgi:hypothetical protein
MSDLVEKVARAIAEDDWGQAPEGRAGQRMMQNRDGTFRDINALSRDEYRDQARAAIAAVAEWLIEEFSYQAEMIEIKQAMVARKALEDDKQ